MSMLVRKAALAVTATAVASALFGSVPAYADSSSIQAQICNQSPYRVFDVTVEGTNQNGALATWVQSGPLEMGDCVVANGYWWKKDSDLLVKWTGSGLGNVLCPVPDSNDDTFTCNFSN
jgi:hypothetical protein